MCRESAMEYGAIVRYDCRLRHLRTTGQFRFLSLIETPYALWSTGNRRVVLVDVKLSSPAGVRKNRKASHRHKELNLLMAERQCEPAVIETEVMRWVPEPVT